MSTTDLPLPSPPFFKVPNINNLRDASLALNNPPNNGPAIRPNILFRSAEVSKLTLPDWQHLASLGISHVFDLRSAPEVAKGWAGMMNNNSSSAISPDVEASKPQWILDMEHTGIDRSWVPVFAARDYSPERLAERYVMYMSESVNGFVGAYREILKDAGPAYRKILMYLTDLNSEQDRGSAAEEGGKGCGALIHCTAGKDRTGIFFGVLFDYLGVPRQQIADEYQLTELGLRHVRDEVVGRLMQSPGFKKYVRAQMEGRTLEPGEIARGLSGGASVAEDEDEDGTQIPPEIQEKGRQAAIRMVGARKETMLRSLEMLDREFGGAEKYLRVNCELGDEDLEKLKRNLLVEKR